VQSTQPYHHTAYGWALQDSTGFCRLYADPATGLLLGAHILGYQASLLIQPLVQAMSFGQGVASMARDQYWIHPALSEVVENALLKLPLDQQLGG
jgi:mycothione reductase